jgi:hypothetical protein
VDTGKAGGIPEVLWDLWEAIRFGVHLGLSDRAVRMQYFELLRRDAPHPIPRIGTAANVLDGAAARQAIYVTMELAPRGPKGRRGLQGLWMRIDVFGREGYRRTFYPFWRDAEVFHDFLTMCADIAEAPVSPDPPDEADEGIVAEFADLAEASEAPDAGEEPEVDGEQATLTLETDFGPADTADPGLERPPALTRFMAWLAARFRGTGRGGTKRLIRLRPGRRGKAGLIPGAGQTARTGGSESPEADSHAIQTTARRGDPATGQCSLMRFPNLPAVFDHVLLTGHRVALKVLGDGPDLWAVVWRRADGGLYLRWGGLEHPAGPIYRESPQTLFQRLSGYDLDIERVWSQARPPGN